MDQMSMNIKAFVAELIGTLALCYIGILTISHLGDVPGGLVGIAFAHGLTIAVMVSATAAISGGHLNPAVTIALTLARKLSPVNAVGYIISQVIGAAAGSFLATMSSPMLSTKLLALGTPKPGLGIEPSKAIVAEVVTTFFLIFVVYGTGVYRHAPKVAGLFIGLTVTIGILAVGPISGGALNPARWLGPSIVANDFTNLSIYLVGPVIGGLLAGALWGYFLEKHEPA
jgi:aquaporin Z